MQQPKWIEAAKSEGRAIRTFISGVPLIDSLQAVVKVINKSKLRLHVVDLDEGICPDITRKTDRLTTLNELLLALKKFEARPNFGGYKTELTDLADEVVRLLGDELLKEDPNFNGTPDEMIAHMLGLIVRCRSKAGEIIAEAIDITSRVDKLRDPGFDLERDVDVLATTREMGFVFEHVLLSGAIGTLGGYMKDYITPLFRLSESAPSGREFLKIEKKLKTATGEKRVRLLREKMRYFPSAMAELRAQSEIVRPDRSAEGLEKVTLSEALPKDEIRRKTEAELRKEFPRLVGKVMKVTAEEKHFRKMLRELAKQGIPSALINSGIARGLTKEEIENAYLTAEVAKTIAVAIVTTGMGEAAITILEPSAKTKLPEKVRRIISLVEFSSIEPELATFGLTTESFVAALVIGFKYGENGMLMGREMQLESEIAARLETFGLPLTPVLDFLKKHRMLNCRGNKVSINANSFDSTGRFVHTSITRSIETKDRRQELNF